MTVHVCLRVRVRVRACVGERGELTRGLPQSVSSLAV